jgi:iron complex transport system permease protein
MVLFDSLYCLVNRMSVMNTKRVEGIYPRMRLIIPLMLAILAVVLVFATAIGAVYIPFFQTVKIILKNWGLLEGTDFSKGQESIIFFVRFPRVVVAALVGAALATSGAVMQGLFRNPMADPGVIGVSSGAGLGAVAAIALGLTAKSIYFTPLFASVGALTAVAIVFLLSVRGGKIPTLTLILAGIAVSTFIGAITSVLLTMINDYQVRAFLFWTVGGLGDRRWEHVKLVAAPILVCILLLFSFARDLNVMLLGEEEAQAVGLNPSRVRKLLLLLVSVTTAMAVSVSGSISFVGLIVPHILRLLVGPDHRRLLPASALGGAIFLVACDLVARVVIIPREVGVGIVTSLVGAPYFLYLLMKSKKEGGEW